MAGTRGTQGTQGTKGTGYSPPAEQAPARQPQPFVPSNSYLPPLSPLRLDKEGYEYRDALLKNIIKLKEASQAYREVVMDTWSTQQIASAGLTAKITTAVIGNAGQGYIANAMTRQAQAAIIKVGDEFYKNSAEGVYYNSDSDAIKRYATGIGDADLQLGNALNSPAGRDKLDQIERDAAAAPDEVSANDFRRRELYKYLDQQGKLDATKAATQNEVGALPDATKFDTTRDISMRRKMAVQAALGDDERFAELLPGYYDQTDNAFIQAAGLTQAQVDAGIERHRRAADQDGEFQKRVDEIVTGYGLPPETKQLVKDAIADYRQALNGDPAALHQMAMSLPTPPEIQSSIEQNERELARQDASGNPNSDRDNFIRAFNTRAGSNKAFQTFAIAMGFRGGRSTDRAAAFAAQYPELSRPFTDAVRADPSILDGGYGTAKAKLRELGNPVGITGPYRLIHPPKPQTPAAALNPTIADMPSMPAVPVAATAAPATEVTPGPAPSPERVPGGENIPVQAADSSLAKAPEVPAAPPSPSPATPAPAPAPAPDAAVLGADGSQPRNRVESRPDGSLVVVRPDGSEMLLSPPGAPGPQLSQPAGPPALPPVLHMPEETITPEPRPLPSPAAAIGARFAPAVAPSNIVGTSETSPMEERELMLQALRAKYMPLDANGQPVPVGGQQ